MTEATILLPADVYVARGVYGDATSVTTWAEQFRALGGDMCRPRPSWQTGAPEGTTAVYVRGTDDAVNFVRFSCLESIRAHVEGPAVDCCG